MAEQATSYAEFAYASKWRRFLGFLIDQIILWGITGIIASATGPLGTLGYFVAAWLYYFLMEQLCNGKTIGKLITKTRVVDIDGHKPQVEALLIRNFILVFPFFLFRWANRISFFWGWNSRHKLDGCWHDDWSKSYVVWDEKTIEEFKSQAIDPE